MKKIFKSLTLLAVSVLLSTTNVLTINAQAQARGAYIRKCVGYDSEYVTTKYDYKKIDTVSADNRKGGSNMTLTYSYTKSGSVTSAITGYGSASAEASTVFAKIKAETGVEVSKSRSWKEGTSVGMKYNVPKGKFHKVDVYIPAMKTEGRLKYKVYMDGYPDKTFYEYKTLKVSYAIKKSGIHFKTVEVK